MGPRTARGFLAAATLLTAGLAFLATAAAGSPIYTIAGSSPPRFGGSRGDGGSATEAVLGPDAVAPLPSGGFLVADAGDDRVRQVWPTGVITTVAGSGRRGGFRGDGALATAARLSGPSGVAALPAGGFLIADSRNNRVRRVDPTGRIETVAGDGVEGFSGDGGPATEADLTVRAVATLPDGGFLVAGGERVRRVWPDGTIATAAGNGGSQEPGEGEPATAGALDADDVAAMPDGGFLVVDTLGGKVRRVWPDGTITTIAGGGSVDTPSCHGELGIGADLRPSSVAVLPDGGFVIGNSGGRVCRLLPSGRLTVIAGNGYTDNQTGEGARRGDGGRAAAAPLASASDLAVLPDGSLIIADVEDGRIRFVPDSTPLLLALAFREFRHDSGSANRYSTRLRVTRASRLRLAVLRGTTPIARGEVAAPTGGTYAMTVRHRFAPGRYAVRATAFSSDGQGSTQRREVVLGGRLPDRLAVEALGGDEHTRFVARDMDPEATMSESIDDPMSRTRFCHRFGARRVDCEIERTVEAGAEPYNCDAIGVARLRRDGQIGVRRYPCPTKHQTPFRRHPSHLTRETLANLADLP